MAKEFVVTTVLVFGRDLQKEEVKSFVEYGLQEGNNHEFPNPDFEAAEAEAAEHDEESHAPEMLDVDLITTVVRSVDEQ